MPSALVGRFMEALRQAEQRRDPAPLVDVFDANASFWSFRRQAQGGEEACRRFWNDYLAAFTEVRSEFRGVREGEGFAVLEWESTGRFPDGGRVRYCGVSILEGDGERLRGFRTYFDTTPFETHAHTHR